VLNNCLTLAAAVELHISEILIIYPIIWHYVTYMCVYPISELDTLEVIKHLVTKYYVELKSPYTLQVSGWFQLLYPQ
jgi:hypothetical protein